jgi:hypothetical protein
MSRPVRSFLSLLLVLQLIIPFSASAAAIGEFSKVVGGVTQTRAQQIIKPVAKAPIELKDIIMTDQASAAIMVFSDDSTIKLEQNSKLEVKEFLFKDKARTGIFSLATGKLTATVRKFIGDDNLFEVHSPTSVAGVRGTGFEFTESMVGGTPTATITCTEGSLTISALSPTGVIVATSVITAGMTAVISGGVITVATTAAGIMGTAATAFSGMSTTQAVGVVAVGLAGGGAAVAVGQAASGGGGKNTVSYSESTSSAAPPATADGVWRILGRCENAGYDVWNLRVTLTESEGNFSGSGSGNDYDGTPMTMNLTGTYNGTSKALSVVATTAFTGNACVRTDTFSTTLTSNDTGYLLAIQGPSCGCTSKFRMIK